jgi:Na+-driven multidrug efflux pump
MSRRRSSATPYRVPGLTGIVAPLLLELVLGIAVGVAGTALAAGIGDDAGASFSLANLVVAMLFVLFRVVGAGIGVVITQALGSGRRATADAVALASLGASTWLGGGCALVALLFAGPLLRLLDAPPSVLPLATTLLVAMAPAMMLDAFNASMSSVLRAHLRGREALAVIVVMQLVLLALAWPAMQGVGDWEGFGLAGFAFALALSRLAGLGLHLALWRRQLALVPRAGDWWRLPRGALAPVLHIGLPGAAENIGWRLAFTFSVAVASGMGAQALATHAYVQQLNHLVMMFGVATGLGMEIVVGHCIGAGKLRQAHAVVRRGLLRGLVVSTLLATAAAFGGPWLLGQFTKDPAILAAGQMLLWWSIGLESGRTYNLVLVNALRAAGDARFPVLAGAASMALVLAGGSWLLGKHFGLGLTGLWIAYVADEWLRGLIMWWRWTHLGWVPHARAARRRMRQALAG